MEKQFPLLVEGTKYQIYRKGGFIITQDLWFLKEDEDFLDFDLRNGSTYMSICKEDLIDVECLVKGNSTRPIPVGKVIYRAKRADGSLLSIMRIAE